MWTQQFFLDETPEVERRIFRFRKTIPGTQECCQANAQTPSGYDSHASPSESAYNCCCHPNLPRRAHSPPQACPAPNNAVPPSDGLFFTIRLQGPLPSSRLHTIIRGHGSALLACDESAEDRPTLLSLPAPRIQLRPSRCHDKDGTGTPDRPSRVFGELTGRSNCLPVTRAAEVPPGSRLLEHRRCG